MNKLQVMYSNSWREFPCIKQMMPLNRQNYDEAAALYAEAIKVNPNEADLYDNRARALTQAKRNEEAMVSINKAIELKPAIKSLPARRQQLPQE